MENNPVRTSIDHIRELIGLVKVQLAKLESDTTEELQGLENELTKCEDDFNRENAKTTELTDTLEEFKEQLKEKEEALEAKDKELMKTVADLEEKEQELLHLKHDSEKEIENLKNVNKNLMENQQRLSEAWKLWQAYFEKTKMDFGAAIDSHSERNNNCFSVGFNASNTGVDHHEDLHSAGTGSIFSHDSGTEAEPVPAFRRSYYVTPPSSMGKNDSARKVKITSEVTATAGDGLPGNRSARTEFRCFCGYEYNWKLE